jgi:4-amino-4-deoxy-L-arabinose transferase-like glycosyltransferase
MLFVGLALSNVLTKSPEIDEGFFASPAFSLLTQHKFATSVLETAGSNLKGIDEHTYWIMPLHPLVQVAWYKVFGISLFSLRTLSIAFGLLALIAMYFIVKELSGRLVVAVLTVVLLSFDYTFVINAALGRMDMMCAALGFAALAAYLVWRGRNLALAIVLSQTLVVLSGMTHPNGILHFFGLLFITLYFDRKQIRFRHVLLALIPYVIAGTAWVLYILQDTQAFIAQFGMNSQDGGRLMALKTPWVGVMREFTQRYPHAFGLRVHSAGHSGPIYLKALILLPHVVAILCCLFVSEIRNNRGYRALLYLVLIYFLILSLIDGQKETPYLIHLFPIYVALLAVCIDWCWRTLPRLRTVVVAGMCAFAVFEMGAILYRARQNTYRNLYQPVIAFLQSGSGPDTSIIGPSGLAFGLNFSPQFKDDIRMGYYSGHRPKFIVINEEYARSFEESRAKNAELTRYINDLLSREYKKVFENDGYTVYQRL